MRLYQSSGHVMRCRNLARLLQQRGAEVNFLAEGSLAI